MYFHHAAGVVAKLEAQAGVFLKNQKQSWQSEMARTKSDRKRNSRPQKHQRAFRAAFAASETTAGILQAAVGKIIYRKK